MNISIQLITLWLWKMAYICQQIRVPYIIGGVLLKFGVPWTIKCVQLKKNIFACIHFRNKTKKKWNLIFTIISIPCKFQQYLVHCFNGLVRDWSPGVFDWCHEGVGEVDWRCKRQGLCWEPEWDGRKINGRYGNNALHLEAMFPPPEESGNWG